MAKKVTELRVGAKTDIGQKRDHNEDDFVLVEQFKARETWPIAQRKGNLYIVADGMGGHNAGEVASRMAVEIISEEYYKDETGEVRASLQQAIETANRRIYERAQEVQAETGMGSTVVAAVIRGDELHIAHVGDSRIYLVQRGKIKQLTADHSWVGEQVAAKLITAEQARSHPYRNYITRSLGIKPEVEVDLGWRKIREGDIIVLCSDGLSGPVSDDEISQAVTAFDPDEACEELIRKANEAGGPDNVTAVVIRVESVVPVANGAPVPVGEEVLGKREREKAASPAEGRRSYLPLLAAVAVVAALVGFLLAGMLWLRNEDLRAQMDLTATAQVALPSASAGPSAEATAPEVAQVFTPAPTETLAPEPAPTDAPTPTELPSPTRTDTLSPTPTWTSMPPLPATNTPVPVPTPSVKVMVSGINVRQGPGTGYGSLGLLSAGRELAVIGYHSPTGWLKVCCVGSGQEGWIYYDPAYTVISVPRDELPAVTYP